MKQKKEKTSEKIYNSILPFAEKYLYSKNMEIRDKCFLLFMAMFLIWSIIVVPAAFLTGQNILGVILSGMFLLILIEGLLIVKYRTYSVFELITCVVFQLILLPAFFMTGGFSGGVLFFFVISIVLSYLVLSRRQRFFHVHFCILTLIIAVYIAIVRPELLIESNKHVTQTTIVIANTISCIVCCISFICILSFQMYLHNKQEELLKEKEEEAQRASVAKSMFLANMSHEIRTPMGVVIGLSEMMQNETNVEALHGMAKNINRTSGLLLNIINDILDFEKVSKGMLEIVDVEYRIDDILGDFKNIGEGRCAVKGLEFSVKKTERVPDFLLGDETRFRQIGTNIINNAIKYTDKGFVEVTIDYDLASEKLILTVKDSGKGIKEEDLPFIFDSFQRSDIKNNRHIEGTGLGLAITKRLAQAMNGSISVISEYGKGSVFTAEISHKKLDKITAVEEVKLEFDLTGKRIFYVDDTKVNTLVFNGLLKDTGAQATFAFSGSEALEIVKNKEFDVIFLDYFMPQMDGVEVLNRMREMGIDCPIIVLTADAVNDAKKKFVDIGFDDYISKPIKKEVLCAMISKHTNMQ